MRKVKISVLAPTINRNILPLLPELSYEPGRKWDYYDQYLRSLADIAYFDLKDWQTVSLWDEFEEYETFLPIGNPHRWFQKGGFGFNEPYASAVIARLKQDLGDAELKRKLLANQRELFKKIKNPAFIAASLGIDSGVSVSSGRKPSTKNRLNTQRKELQAIPKDSQTRLSVLVLFPRVDFQALPNQKVTYQAAQFYHLSRKIDVTWLDAVSAFRDVRTIEKQLQKQFDAVIVFDEYSLLKDPVVSNMTFNTDALLVYVTHDFWCHPLRVAEKLRKQEKVLMVLRHESARRLFDFLLPGVPKVVQRPGVELSIFHPGSEKKYDVLLGGSETPDYPLRQKINAVVRENATRFGWNVLDLTGKGLMSNPPGNQIAYAPALAASKVSPTASNRGGAAGAKLAMQYFDLSPARAQFDDDFYGLGEPEFVTWNLNTAGITPRYLESLASKSLLIADLPETDYQNWYADKMVLVHSRMSDQELIEIIDYWVKNDEERERLCNYAYLETVKSESSEKKAVELIEILREHLS